MYDKLFDKGKIVYWWFGGWSIFYSCILDIMFDSSIKLLNKYQEKKL